MGFKEDWNWLNTYQMDAVMDESPACIVNANVGSGKTTVLIAKILYLHYEKQIPLEDMVVLTFTNKAAGEIIERLKAKQPDLTEDEVWRFGTFHSVAMRMLKKGLGGEAADLDEKITDTDITREKEAAINEVDEKTTEFKEWDQNEERNQKKEWDQNFTIIDPDEEAELALSIIEKQNLKIKYKNRLKKRLEQEYPNYKKGKLTSRYKDDLFLLFPLLRKEKKRLNKMSFSDLLEEGINLLNMGKTSRPKWIIVDEVQDSDASQLEFLEALKGPDTRIFAVGDPNQVIYSFRGTTQNMFFLLKNRFEARELSLPLNYRSNASILEAANRFLQFGGKIQGNNQIGGKIRIKNHYDQFQEAMYLAEQIDKLHEEGKSYQDIAIFYRLQKQVEVLKNVFDQEKIPYEVSVKKTWKDIPVLDWLIKVLRFSVNPEDELTGIQVLTDKRFGEKCTKKKAEDIIRNRKTDKSSLFRQMLLLSDRNLKLKDLYEFLGLREALHPTSADYQEDSRQVIQFLNQISEYSQSKKLNGIEGIREFLNSVALENNRDLQKETVQKEKVHLMTLHASKGLEFDTVFMIGVNPGLLPMRSSSFDQEEEERRLFFVGITRAKNHLELSYYTNPGEPGVLGTYSNYLRMIPQELLEWEELRSDEEKRTNLKELARQAKAEIRKTESQNAESANTDNTNKKQAVHQKYGTGIVISEDDMMIEVEFPNYGKKEFIKAFGEIEVLEN